MYKRLLSGVFSLVLLAGAASAQLVIDGQGWLAIDGFLPGGGGGGGGPVVEVDPIWSAASNLYSRLAAVNTFTAWNTFFGITNQDGMFSKGGITIETNLMAAVLIVRQDNHATPASVQLWPIAGASMTGGIKLQQKYTADRDFYIFGKDGRAFLSTLGFDTSGYSLRFENGSYGNTTVGGALLLDYNRDVRLQRSGVEELTIDDGAGGQLTAGVKILGPFQPLNANGAITIGDSTTVGGSSSTSVAIGFGAAANCQQSVAIGHDADVAAGTAVRAVALGHTSYAAIDGVAVGRNAEANNTGSMALGSGSDASANYAIAIGYVANAPDANHMVLGNSNYIRCVRSGGSNWVDFGSALYPWRTGYFHTIVVDIETLLIGTNRLSVTPAGEIVVISGTVSNPVTNAYAQVGAPLSDFTNDVEYLSKTPGSSGNLTTGILDNVIASAFSGYHAISTDGNYAYITDSASEDKVFIYNISDPTNIVSAGSVTLSGDAYYPTGCKVWGDYLYVPSTDGATTTRLYALDISNPASPSMAGTGIVAAVDCGYLTINEENSHAYTYDGGFYGSILIHVFDLTTPSTPVWKVSKNHGYAVSSIATTGSVLCVGDLSAPNDYLGIYDISNPTNLVQKYLGKPSGANALVMSVVMPNTNTVICAGGIKGIMVYDISDLTTPVGISSNQVPGLSGLGLAIEDNRLYVAYKGTGTTPDFRVVDISDLANLSTLWVTTNAVFRSANLYHINVTARDGDYLVGKSSQFGENFTLYRYYPGSATPGYVPVGARMTSVTAATDPTDGAQWAQVTNWVASQGFLTSFTESDPIWSGVSNLYPLIANFANYETDPLWSSESNLYYFASNPSAFVDKTVTNGLADKVWVEANYPTLSGSNVWYSTNYFSRPLYSLNDNDGRGRISVDIEQGYLRSTNGQEIIDWIGQMIYDHRNDSERPITWWRGGDWYSPEFAANRIRACRYPPQDGAPTYDTEDAIVLDIWNDTPSQRGFFLTTTNDYIGGEYVRYALRWENHQNIQMCGIWNVETNAIADKMAMNYRTTTNMILKFGGNLPTAKPPAGYLWNSNGYVVVAN